MAIPALVLVTDTRRLSDPLPAAARLPRGSAVLLRHYDAPGRADLALALARLCRAKGLRLLVAADWRLADAVGADGLHLPESLARRAPAPLLGWRRAGPRLLTVAAHSPSALRLAARLGADAALLSPLCPTASHPGAPTLGPVRAAAWTGAAPLPVIGLGGITGETARRLAGSGIAGLAAVGLYSAR